MKHVICSCGYVASGATADELLTAVEEHIAAAHGHQARELGDAAVQDSAAASGFHSNQEEIR